MSATTPIYYVTKEGDTVDLIAFRYYGSTYGGQVEAILEANRSLALADYGPILPRGLTITLPEIVAPTKQVVRLFS